MHRKTHHPGYSYSFRWNRPARWLAEMGTKPFRMRCPGFGLQPGCVGKIPTLRYATQRCQTLGEHYVSLTICRMAQLVLDEAEKFLHPEGVSTFFAELVELCFFLFSMYMIVYVYSVYCMHTYNYIYIHTYIQSIYLSINLSIYLPIYLSIYLLLYDICIM